VSIFFRPWLNPMADLLTPEYLAAEAALFERAWDAVRSGLLGDLSMCGPSIDRIAKLLDYTCKGGKMTRAKTITRAVDLKLRAEAAATPGNGVCNGHGAPAAAGAPAIDPLFDAAVLGWCIEILQAYFLVMDDIVDHSETRRFQPCWYKLPDVGVGLGVVDSVLLRSFVFNTLRRFLGTRPYYARAFELFEKCAYMTEIGEMLDTLSEQRRDLSYITEDTYFNIVWHKTCYYTIHLPLALGLLVTGDLDTTIPEAELKQITFLVGEYFQIQDDLLDCYADPKHIGKVGTDIQDFKCSWLAVQFLQRATPDQRTIFVENYGKHEEEAVAKIKVLYDEVGIKQLFENLEEDYGRKVADLTPKLGAKSPTLQRSIEALWKVTYKRTY
jgi:farnesyl diphosphate synthase